ncbi:MAG: hypothetical protein AB7T06_00620 [Kofleriaceae bacterium]
MRSSIIAAALVLLTSTAIAGSRGGGGSGGGRLGRVSKGVGDAVGGDRGGGGGGGGGGGDDRRDDPPPRPVYDDPDYHRDWRREERGRYIVLVDGDGYVRERFHKPAVPEVNRVPARFDLFLGLQKVVESDTSFSATAAVSDDWFRLAAYGSRYWEDRMDGDGKLTMTMGGGTFGFPVQVGGRSLAYLEGGVVLLKTANNMDPADDASITGGKVGFHLEQGLRKVTIIGDAHALLFEADVRAYEARVAVRYGHFEGALRVLDFNVGPALFGPEVGLAF